MPTLVYNPCDRDISLFKTHNIYHTHLEFAEFELWPLSRKQPMGRNNKWKEYQDDWHQHVLQFIERAKVQEPYKLDVNNTHQIFKPYEGQNG
jgi:hypothetical protein